MYVDEQTNGIKFSHSYVRRKFMFHRRHRRHPLLTATNHDDDDVLVVLVLPPHATHLADADSCI